jgi:hypothetical protein
MSIEETIKFLALVKLSYPNSYKDIDATTQKATVNMWHKKFENTPFKIVEMALDHFINVSKFPPTVADIREELTKIYYEALQNAMTLPEGQMRNLNKYIMQHTECFTDRNEHRINYSKVENLLTDGNHPLLEGGDG